MVSEVAGAQPGAAASTCGVLAGEDPVLLTGAQRAGERALHAATVGLDHAPTTFDHAPEVGHIAHTASGQQPRQEAQLVDVLVAETSEVSLVVECEEHRPVGFGAHPPHCLVEAPVGAQKVGSEVGERSRLVAAREPREKPTAW